MSQNLKVRVGDWAAARRLEVGDDEVAFQVTTCGPGCHGCTARSAWVHARAVDHLIENRIETRNGNEYLVLKVWGDTESVVGFVGFFLGLPVSLAN